MSLLGPIPRNTSGDWPEDFAHENGNYHCDCCVCHETFIGHKRRQVCKVCATRDEAEAKRRGQWLHDHGAPKDWVILTMDEVRQMHGESARFCLEAHVERKLRRELAEAARASIRNDRFWTLTVKDAIADSEKLDAEIAAKERAKQAS